MQLLPVSFKILTVGGFWRPVDWSPNMKEYWMYNLFSLIMMIFLHSYTVFLILDVFADENLDNFIDKLSICMSVFGVSVKVVNLFIRRSDIIALVNTLMTDDCIPQDEEETLIKSGCDKDARQMTIGCECLNEATAFVGALAHMDNFLRKYNTPDFSWVLYDVSMPIVFWATLFQQGVGLLVCANASVGHDTLIAGLMMHTSAQLEMLCHRARLLPETFQKARDPRASQDDIIRRERKAVARLVRHHLFIYKFAETTNTIFTLMLFLQFALSSMVLCMSVYKMSTKSLFSAEFLWTALYLASMLMQIFIYCWFGNEMSIKSMEFGQALYEMDWTTLRSDIMRDLLVMMMRTTKPIKMTSGHVIVLSVESFASILKMSYSTFNVLQSSKSSD